MLIRVLGAHNLEAIGARHSCFLVDNVLTVDAGSLMSTLDRGEKDALESILLTHRHFDHVRDLLSLGLYSMQNSKTIDVYGIPDTLVALTKNLMNGELYPDFTQRPTLECPTFNLKPIEFEQEFSVSGFTVKAISVPHNVPAAGFVLRSPTGEVAAFSGDTGGGLVPFFTNARKPDVLITEVTYPNMGRNVAQAQGHLCPDLLNDQLLMARNQGYLIPDVIVTHMDQRYEGLIAAELADVSANLRVNLILGSEGMEYKVQ